MPERESKEPFVLTGERKEAIRGMYESFAEKSGEEAKPGEVTFLDQLDQWLYADGLQMTEEQKAKVEQYLGQRHTGTTDTEKGLAYTLDLIFAAIEDRPAEDWETWSAKASESKEA